MRAKPNWNSYLLMYFETAFAKRNAQSVFVDRFDETMPEFVINLVKNTNNVFRQLEMQKLFVCSLLRHFLTVQGSCPRHPRYLRLSDYRDIIVKLSASRL